MSESVFLGLVTHAGTRFPGSATAAGLIPRLAAELDRFDVPTQVSIHADDRFEESILPLDTATIRASIAQEMRVEKRWRKRLSPRTPSPVIDAFMSLRGLYRRLHYAPPWGGSGLARGKSMVRRLVNIELAHLTLLRQALDAGTDWALIVEDDASCQDVSALAADLAAFIGDRGEQTQPQYVNMSRSFSDERLGTSGQGIVVGPWHEGEAMVISYDVANTNTVCAVLYRGAFLELLVPRLEAIPLAPVIPIDWKLNMALMDLEQDGLLRSGDCWTIQPAPIIQGSMHSGSD